MNMILDYIAPNGQSLKIANNGSFILTGADGLTSATVGIAATDITGGDGSVINSSRAQPRGIVLYMTIPQGQNVELVKRSITQIIKPKQTGRLYWEYQGRAVEIEGTVESIVMPRFVQEAVIQITLYCAQPYWQDAEFIVEQISLIVALHHFELVIPQTDGFVMGVYNLEMTRTFFNDGDATIGCTITIVATGDVTNPLLERDDGLFLGINTTMEAGDNIVINTAKGQKSIYKNGVNIIDKIKPGSSWLQLEVGQNVFTISDDIGEKNMYFSFVYKRKYV